MTKRTTDPGATYRAALQHFQKGRFGQARALLVDLQRAYPNDGDVRRMLGAALSELGRHDDAIGHLLRAVELAPSARDFFNLGKALQLAGRYERALRAHDTGLKLEPADLQLRHGQASTLCQLGRFDEAITAYRDLVGLAPDFVEARCTFADVLLKSGQPSEALVQLQRADVLEPDHSTTIGGLVRAKLMVCDWAGIEPLIGRLIAAVKAGARMDPFTVLTVCDQPDVQLRAAQSWVGSTASPVVRQTPSPVTDTKLRIGYVSADFRNHAVSHLMAGLLEAHDRGTFEIIAVSQGRDDGSALRTRIAAGVDRFVDISALSGPEALARVAALDLHVAVDLMGHTADTGDRLFQTRMAPVQVNFLGYPGTTALATMDYIVMDRFIATPVVCRNLTEAAVVLPDCFQPNDPRRSRPGQAQSRDAYGLPDGCFVFVSFNNTGKLTPAMFAAWMRILSATPGSVLWLTVADEIAQANLRGEAVRAGVAAERLVFATRVASHEDHLARYLVADVFLDSFPYGAHTTASDALWMGCPVMTQAGQSYPSRVAGSLLTTVGLPELIATSLDAYEQLAIKLAQNPGDCARYRRQLDACRATTPLFDVAVFAKNLERAYLEMWHRHQRGSKPKAIHLA